MPLVKIIAVINQKGGVGKTTTVANLGAALASRGYTTCLVDLDPQSHLTLHFGIEPGQPESSVYDVLTSEEPIQDAAVRVDDGLLVVPSTIDLAAAEVELVTTVGREQILRDRFAEAHGLGCDVAMLDCPPSLGLLTLNALAAADEVLIPLQPHFLALQGLGKLLETVSLVQKRINPTLRVAGVILCMYESNTRLAAEVTADLQAFFDSSRGQAVPWAGARILRTPIRRNVKLAECPSHGTTIFDYDPASHGAADYNTVADDFLSAVFRSNSTGTPQEPAGDEDQPDAEATHPEESAGFYDRTDTPDLSPAPAAETGAGVNESQRPDTDDGENSSAEPFEQRDQSQPSPGEGGQYAPQEDNPSPSADQAGEEDPVADPDANPPEGDLPPHPRPTSADSGQARPPETR
jgi:chromosome partitioning protein